MRICLCLSRAFIFIKLTAELLKKMEMALALRAAPVGDIVKKD